MLVPNGYPEFKQISTLIQATFASLGYQPPIEEVEIAQWSSASTRAASSTWPSTTRRAARPIRP